MLDERLERLSRIGEPKSVAFVARWLSEGITLVDDFSRLARITSGINASDIEPIIWLFQSMGLLKLQEDGSVDSLGIVEQKYLHGIDSFNAWFAGSLVDFVLSQDIVDACRIYFNITTKSLILPITAIRPSKYACYRNLLINYNIITLLPDCTYKINDLLDKALAKPEKQKKISEKQLLKKLEAQRKQGERGELFVLDYERRRIKDPQKKEQIKRISPFDVAAGFDIISFKNDESNEPDLFIEVKTYKGPMHFIWSDNEKDKASVMGDSYCLYLVDDSRIEDDDYSPIIIPNPFESVYKSSDWLVEPDSYRVTRVD